MQNLNTNLPTSTSSTTSTQPSITQQPAKPKASIISSFKATLLFRSSKVDVMPAKINNGGNIDVANQHPVHAADMSKVQTPTAETSEAGKLLQQDHQKLKDIRAQVKELKQKFKDSPKGSPERNDVNAQLKELRPQLLKAKEGYDLHKAQLSKSEKAENSKLLAEIDKVTAKAVGFFKKAEVRAALDPAVKTEKNAATTSVKAQESIQDVVDSISDTSSEAGSETSSASSVKFTNPLSVLKRFSSEKTISGKSPQKGEGPPGKSIEVNFKDKNGNVVATEKTERADTIKILLNGLKTEQKALQQELKKLSGEKKPNEKRMQKVKAKLEKVEKEIQQCQASLERGATWANTNSARNGFENLGEEKYKEECLPALANCRTQKVVDANGNVISSIGRSAAVTDFSHPDVSLKELKDYADLTDLSTGKLDSTSIRANNLINLYGLKNPDGSLNKEKTASLLVWLEKAAVKSYGESAIMENGQVSKAKLKDVIQERREKLERQVMQDLYTHFQAKPVGDKRTICGRTSLVNMQKDPKVEKSGFTTDESTQALDTKAIYDEFDHKTILFDVEDGPDAGPYMDLDGQIHMPKSCKDSKLEADSTTLRTVVFNISTTINTDNVGMQKAINEEAMTQLEALGKQLDPQAQAKIAALRNEYFNPEGNEDPIKDDPFAAAAAVVKLISELGYSSANCYGGKDRTGYTLAKITHAHLEKLVEGDPKAKKLTTRWGQELVGDDSTLSEVIYDNANHRALKLTAYNLDLYSPNTVGGGAKRIGDIVEAGRSFFAKKDETRVDQLYNQPSDVEKEEKPVGEALVRPRNLQDRHVTDLTTNVNKRSRGSAEFTTSKKKSNEILPIQLNRSSIGMQPVIPTPRKIFLP